MEEWHPTAEDALQDAEGCWYTVGPSAFVSSMEYMEGECIDSEENIDACAQRADAFDIEAICKCIQHMEAWCAQGEGGEQAAEGSCDSVDEPAAVRCLEHMERAGSTAEEASTAKGSGGEDAGAGG